MVQYRFHALVSMALLTAASPTVAFQAPKSKANTPKSSLDASIVERPLSQRTDLFFEPIETTVVKDVVEKHGGKGLAGKTDLEKRLQKGAAFRSTSMQKTAEQMLSAAAVPTVSNDKVEEQPAAVVQQQMVAVAASSQDQSGSEAIAGLDLSKISNVEKVEEQPAAVDQQQMAAVAAPSKDQSGSEAIAGLDLSKISNVLSPTEAFQALVQKGEANAASQPEKLLFSSALGGCYVGMGAMVSLAVAGNSPEIAAADPGLQKFIFAALFPMNLLLAQQAGGMLYTGNTASMMAAVCEKRATVGDMGRVLFLSWIGNLFGCALFAIACKYAGVMEGGAAVLAAKTLVGKTSAELGPVFVKAMFCNWLVCLAVLLSTQAKDMGGKYISIWLPVSTFVSIGFEHSVANMFLLPAGLLSQDEITFGTALTKNLIPVTIGNAFSGALLVGATMSYLFGSLGKPQEEKQP